MMPFLLSTASALALSLSSTMPSGEGTTTTVTSSTVSATVSGGTPPYTYAWARTSGSSLVNALNPSAASTAFQGSGMARGQTLSAVFALTVTDSLAQTIQSTAVTVTLDRIAFDGGGTL